MYGVDTKKILANHSARNLDSFTMLNLINFNCGDISVLLQCDTDEIHTCCFTPNGSVFASGPAEAETTICIY